MQCVACGYTTPHNRAPEDNRCMMCADKDMVMDADDFLLHGAENLITDSREGQVEMGRAVEQALKKEEVLLVEGPVGVGKSFAYLIPAVLSGKRTVISTAQKALQTQLGLYDGPRIRKAVEPYFPNVTVAVLKGKNNYACRLHIDLTSDIPEFGSWLSKSETADMSEYTGRRPDRISDVTADGCLGTRCPHARDCGYRHVRASAMAAQILIVNHYLTAFDLRFGPMRVLGEYSNLIVDEAHKATSAFRSAFEESISNRGSGKLVSKFDTLDHLDLPMSGNEVNHLWETMFQRVAHLNGTIGPDPFGSVGRELLAGLQATSEFINSELGVLNRAHLEGMDTFKTKSDLPLADLTALVILGKSVAKIVTALQLFENPTPNTLLTVEKNQGTQRFKATPISVGALVGEKIGMIPSTVFTSGTMAFSSSFADFRRRLGLNKITAMSINQTLNKPPGASAPVPVATGEKVIKELAVKSPFDYRAQGAFLYAPRHIVPAIHDDGSSPVERDRYIQSIAKEVLALVRASRGDALVLFTSTIDLKETYTVLDELDSTIPWITQDKDTGEGADAVLAKFRKTPGGVILGLKSFWEGVSVEGDKLWLVIITKFPFPVRNDPIHQAESKQLEASLLKSGVPQKEVGFAVFQTLTLPPMLTDLRQGAGRLVRTTTDRGVLAILDTRIWTGKTGAVPEPNQAKFRGYGARIPAILGFAQSWTADFDYVTAKFNQWRKS